MSQNGKENTGIGDKFFDNVNLGNLEQMDPSLEVKIIEEDNEGVGSCENINAKLLIQGEVQNPQMVKLELSSEVDLFFHYTSIESIDSFDNLKTKQELTLQFEGFIGLLIKLLNNLKQNSSQNFAIMSLYPDGRAKIDFMQNLHYKYINLLTLDLNSSDQEIIRESITYRYNLIKAKMMYLQSNFKQFSQLVKTKNPSLLVQLEKQFKKNGKGPKLQALENSMKQSNFMANSFKK